MLLKEYLNLLTKQQLVDFARDIDMKKYSTLKKAELIERLYEYFLTNEVLRNRVSCLTKEQMTIFRKACEKPVEIKNSELTNCIYLNRYFLGDFQEEDDYFCVFDEVVEVFKRIDDDKFRDLQFKRGWMVKCLNFFYEFYKVAPIEIIYKMYKLKVKGTIKEMIDLIEEMPLDVVDAYYFSSITTGFSKLDKDDPLYSRNGHLINTSLLVDGSINYLLREQNGKDFYTPNKQQIEEIYAAGYEESIPAYSNLRKYLMIKYGLNNLQANMYCLKTCSVANNRDSIGDIFDEMVDNGVEISDMDEANQLLGYIIEAYNNTRVLYNRGYTPLELAKKMPTAVRPTIVPGSTTAARMLQQAAPEIEKMGMKLDLDGGADYYENPNYLKTAYGSLPAYKKVYPNDPCPCGSGKRYKNCCGKTNMN